MKTVAAQVIAGNPLTFNFYIENFYNKWEKYTDKLYVQLDTSPNSLVHLFPEIKRFFYDICSYSNKIVITEHDICPSKFIYKKINYVPNSTIRAQQTWTGACMRQALDSSNEDIMFFTHDDCFITDSSILKSNLEDIKYNKFDMIVASSQCLPLKLKNIALEKFSFLKNIVKSDSVGLTTSYFIANRSDLLNTQLNFDGQLFKKGDIISGLDYVVEEEDDIIFLEQSMDVLYQMYKNGKNNPLILLEEGESMIANLHEFKTNFDNYKSHKRKYGHIHLTGGAWSKNIMAIPAKEYVDSAWELSSTQFIDYHFYDKISQFERIMCGYLSFYSLIDLNKYPYMQNFMDAYLKKIEELIVYMNKILKNINYNNKFFTDECFTDKLCNFSIPYEININTLPTKQFRELYE